MCVTPHFPVDAGKAAQFSAVCRDPGTFVNYLAHLKSACEFLRLPTGWASDPRLKRSKDGLVKAGLAFKGPKRSVGGQMIMRVASAQGGWAPERFFVLFHGYFCYALDRRDPIYAERIVRTT